MNNTFFKYVSPKIENSKKNKNKMTKVCFLKN